MFLTGLLVQLMKIITIALVAVKTLKQNKLELNHVLVGTFQSAVQCTVWETHYWTHQIIFHPPAKMGAYKVGWFAVKLRFETHPAFLVSRGVVQKEAVRCAAIPSPCPVRAISLQKSLLVYEALGAGSSVN